MTDREQTTVAVLRPIVCWAWHLRFLGPPEHTTGARCIHCRRDVAAPATARLPVCLYCGMDRGLVPIEEVKP